MKKTQWALFRFQLIQPLLDCERGEQEPVLQSLLHKPVQAPDGRWLTFSRATWLRWLSRYRQRGMKGLTTASRKDRGTSKAIDPELAAALVHLKQEKPRLTIEALIYQARCQGILSPGQHLSRVTLWRLFKKLGLMTPHIPQVDRRRFEAEAPLELVQSDVMHGPRIQHKKSYLIAFIDDHSRLILHAQFRPRETVREFIIVLKQALKRRGLPRKLYVDNGSCFRATRVAYALASLGVNLVRATPYQPQGKGKCERWFRTVRENFLPQLSLQQTQNLDRLNEALWHWIDNYYHQSTHRSTGQAPLERFIQGLKTPRPAPAGLDDYFRQRVLRKVGKDRAVSLNGRAYEAPLGSIGKRLELHFHPESSDSVEAFDSGESLGFLKPLLIHANAKVRRNKTQDLEMESQPNRKTPRSGRVPFTQTKKG